MSCNNNNNKVFKFRYNTYKIIYATHTYIPIGILIIIDYLICIKFNNFFKFLPLFIYAVNFFFFFKHAFVKFFRIII